MKIIQTLRIPGSALSWQVAVQNRTTKHWYFAQAIMKETGQEDTVYHHFDENGVWLDSMTQVDGGHPTAFGITPDDVIYTTHRDGEHDATIVSFPYKPKTAVAYNEVKDVDVFFNAVPQISLSPTGTWAAIREIKKADDVYYRRRLSDLQKGLDKPWGLPVKVSRDTDRVMQGFGLSDEFLFVLRGATKAPVIVEKYSFASGKKIDESDITKYAWREGEKPTTWEGEGVDGSRFGIKVHSGAKKELRILG